MCGGQSLRMGTDKGLMPVDGTCRAAYMANKLKALTLPHTISVNKNQPQSYKAYFDEDDMVIDSLDIAGPLNGLLSVHAKFPHDDLLLLACDMINMQPETLNRLKECYIAEPHYDFYVYQNKEFAEPFCGIYTAKGLSLLMQKETSGLSGISLQKVLNMGDTFRLPVTDPGSFNNFNYK